MSANGAPAGGAVALRDPAIPSVIEYSTLSNNIAATGIITSNGPTTIRNTIMIGGNGTACSGPGAKTLAGVNFLPDNSCGQPFNGADPLLGPLADNGGPTPTQALLTGSPAIDVAAPCTIAVDQRGLLRPNPCDAGAYQTGISPTLIAITPDAAPQGALSFTLTVTGASFISGTVALWNGGVRSTTVLNTTTLSVAIPAGDLVSGGVAQVQARYGEAADSVSNALPFTIAAPTSTPTPTPSPTATLAPGEPTFTPTATPTLAPGEPTFTPSPTPTIPPGGAPLARLPALFLNQPID
jgi:hypothetical protein